jgi:hypothetical protein
MRIYAAVGIASGALAFLADSAAGQKTGDRAELVFTISGAYIQGKGLWNVARQPLQEPPLPPDTLFLSRNIKSTLGAGLSAIYYLGDRFGLLADAFLIGLAYDDECRLIGPEFSGRNAAVCRSITQQDRSAAAATLSVGGIFRIASRDYISPFVRASAGLLFSNQSSLLTSGMGNTGAELVIYDDDTRSRVRPAFGLGVGATVAVSRGYHIRAEVRDHIVGVEAVTGTTSGARTIPPHETRYKNMFSVLIGLDVILERQRGRRY